MLSTRDGSFSYFDYNPSLAGVIIFAIIFGLTTILHLVQILKFKTWYFLALMIGGIFEVIGYAARGILAEESPNWTRNPYIIQTIFILVPPAFFAASIYMVLGNIIVTVDGESYSLIKKRWLTKTFVTGDVLSFLVQAGGGAILAGKSTSDQNLGANVILAGLGLQIALFGFFVVIAIIFHSRMNAMPTSKSQNIPWKKFMYVLYITSGMIMVRSILRLIEFIQGFDGYIIQHEWFLYVFDALPMASVMIVFNVLYPSMFTKQARRAYVDMETQLPAANLDFEMLRDGRFKK